MAPYLFAGLALTLHCSRAGAGESILESRYRITTGDVREVDGSLEAVGKVALTVRLDDSGVITVRGRAGTDPSGISLSFLDRDGKAARPFTMVARNWVSPSGQSYPDAYLQMPFPMRFFVRPNMGMYRTQTAGGVPGSWFAIPGASQHNFDLQFRRNDTQFEVWFDGDYLGDIAAPPQISSCQVALGSDAALTEVSGAPAEAPATTVELPIALHPRPLVMDDAHLLLDAGANLPAALGWPMTQAPTTAAEGIAVAGLGRIPNLGSDDLQSFFWRRHASDNLPEQRMFSVPLTTYSSAWVLCAAEDDPAKVAAFTLRVTRYATSRGNAMADTLVTVPKSEAGASGNAADPLARRVGHVDYGPAAARRRATLWLLQVPIKNGLIQDLIYDDTRRANGAGNYKYLDVELLDPLESEPVADAFPPPVQARGRAYTPRGAQSAVSIFAMALQRSPASLLVRSQPACQAFYAADKAAFAAQVQAVDAGNYSLHTELADIDGKIVWRDDKPLKLAANTQGAITVAVPPNLGNGWYAARIILEDAGRGELVDYRTSFVMLPPDSRKAGLESPFYGWWFGNNHSSDIKLDEVGPLLQRLGVRRASLPDDMPESATLKYGFTDSTLPWLSKGLSQYGSGKMNLADAVALQEGEIRERLARWPSINRMLVFHESGASGAPFPSELWGETPPALPDKYAKSWQMRIEYLTAMAQMVRQKFPQLKMQYGNDGSSLDLVGELMRRKFPRQYIDSIASEDLGQTITPERSGIYSTGDGWYLRRLAQVMGYADVPVTACTEWIGRMSERLGLQGQAEWKVRDGLLALAYGYDTISIAGINDASDGYYYSIWANGGLTTRYPGLAPKPAYAAVATLTQVLDGAKFSRWVDTGSTVLYAQEFQRGNQWIYAFWTPRGRRQVELKFASAGPRRSIDLYGRESALQGAAVTLQASTSVCYIVSPTKVEGVIAGASSFPLELAAQPPANAAPAAQTVALDTPGALAIAADPAPAAATANSPLGKLVEGQFELHTVDDPTMGKCVEVELKPNGDLRLGAAEYVTLQLQNPVTTQAGRAGLWIRGNGGWGAVDLVTTPPNKAPWADNRSLQVQWSSQACLNFDGWNFIAYAPPATPPANPTVVSGLRLVFPRQTLAGTEMVPVVNQKIRIKSIVLY